MNIRTYSEIDRTVHAFINHRNNYMRIPYATEIRIREALKNTIDNRRITEEEFWEMLTDICPAFCDFMAAY